MLNAKSLVPFHLLVFDFYEELLEEWQFESKSVGCVHEATNGYCYSQACIIIIIIINNNNNAVQLFMQSFGLLNQFLPFPDKGLPIWHFWLLYIFSNIILPACLWSSYWPSWNGFLGVYCLDHSCFLHPFSVTKPSQSLCSNEVYSQACSYLTFRIRASWLQDGI